MERRGGIGQVFNSLPTAHKVMVAAAAALLAMGAFFFYQWISTPSYTLLYSDLDDQSLAQVVDELERMDVPYTIEGGGTQVLVPRSQVYGARAELASAGVRSRVVPEGYERLDNQSLNTSDFQQEVNYQIALEGELERTLIAMSSITAADVHLVIPDRALFAEDEEDPTASVLITSARPIDEPETETITYLVAASVEGLTAQNVTVADVDGNVLHAAGVEAGSSTMTSRNMRMTRDYEEALASDVQTLLTAVLGAGRSRVVVRADLDFDEVTTERESIDPESQTAVKESTITETFNGTGTPPGGTVGVDGAPLPTDDEDGYAYDRSETIREYGIDRAVSSTVAAPGEVQRLTAAVLVDDGANTGGATPDTTEIEGLVAAAIGADVSRGDEISVTTAAFPTPAETDPVAISASSAGTTDMIPQAVGAAVLGLVVLALLFMARGAKKKVVTPVEVGAATPAGLPSPATAGVGGRGGASSEIDDGAALPPVAEGSIQPDVIDMVQRQPEEIAVLLRGWLADRR